MCTFWGSLVHLQVITVNLQYMYSKLMPHGINRRCLILFCLFYVLDMNFLFESFLHQDRSLMFHDALYSSVPAYRILISKKNVMATAAQLKV